MKLLLERAPAETLNVLTVYLAGDSTPTDWAHNPQPQGDS